MAIRGDGIPPVLALPGALVVLALTWLRRAVPHPSVYENLDTHPIAQLTESAGAPFPARFWLYCAFTAISMTGFATFGVLSYHLEVRHVLPSALIPVTYSVAMGTAALAALGSGRLYDRIGLRGLVIALPLTAIVPFLSFSSDPTWVWIGAAVWGAAGGIHESTLRAAVADMVPRARRGTAYGIFTAVYGLAWLAGSTAIGALYEHSAVTTIYFVIATQTVAFALFIPLTRQDLVR